jgi:hypothetical protein
MGFQSEWLAPHILFIEAANVFLKNCDVRNYKYELFDVQLSSEGWQ